MYKVNVMYHCGIQCVFLYQIMMLLQEIPIRNRLNKKNDRCFLEKKVSINLVILQSRTRLVESAATIEYVLGV